jgi:hypothetical protein
VHFTPPGFDAGSYTSSAGTPGHGRLGSPEFAITEVKVTGLAGFGWSSTSEMATGSHTVPGSHFVGSWK